MNWLDLVLGTILGISIGSGLYKGFFRLSIGLAATIISVLAASWFYGLAASVYAPYVKQETFANFLGYLTILLGIQFAGYLLARILATMTKKVGLGWVDRLLGGGFGLIRGLLFCIVIVMILTAFSWNGPSQAVAKSRLAPYVMQGAAILVYLTPREIRDGFQKNYEKIREQWKKVLADPVKEVPKALEL